MHNCVETLFYHSLTLLPPYFVEFVRFTLLQISPRHVTLVQCSCGALCDSIFAINSNNNIIILYFEVFLSIIKFNNFWKIAC